MNREIVSGGGASIYPLTGDVLSTPGSPTVSVTGLDGIPLVFSTLDNGDFLVYDETVNNWVNRSQVIPPAVDFQTNGVDNSSQILLNLIAGTNVTLTESAGSVTIDAAAGVVGRSATTVTANGRFWTWTDGTIEAYGMITISGLSGFLGGGTITFPTTFPTSVDDLQVTLIGLPNSGSSDTASVQVNSFNGSGAVVDVQCSVPTGGGGTTFNQNIVISWRAIGH